MEDSREGERSTLAHVRAAWDDARMERNLSALMARLRGRRPRRRRLPSLLAHLRLSRAAR